MARKKGCRGTAGANADLRGLFTNKEVHVLHVRIKRGVAFSFLVPYQTRGGNHDPTARDM